jgi:hypothetical protein
MITEGKGAPESQLKHALILANNSQTNLIPMSFFLFVVWCSSLPRTQSPASFVLFVLDFYSSK